MRDQVNITRCDVMSPSLSPAARVRARSLSGLWIDKSDHSVAAETMAAAGEPSSCGTGNSLWPASRGHSVRIQARFMSETRLRLSSKTTLRQERRERAPSTVLAQILHRLSAPGSWAAATRWESRLGIDLSIDNAVAAPEVACPRWENGRRFCLPRPHRKPVFRRWLGYLHLHAAILRWWAMSVGFGDRQPCPRRSRPSSDGVARRPRGRGTACWRTARSINPQYRHFAIDSGPYPADVFDGVSRKRDEAVPAQSARPDPAPARALSRAEGDLGIDR